MKYGLYLPNQGEFANPHLLVHLAERAEARGWDGFFLWDELLPIAGYYDGLAEMKDPGAVVDPWPILAAVAVRTSSIRLGALVTPLSRREPVEFFRATSTVDILSDGRLIVGAGVGGPEAQFTRLGDNRPPGNRAVRLDEALGVLKHLWLGTQIVHTGLHFLVDNVAGTPPPIQQPRPPVWIGGGWDSSPAIRRAGRWDGFVPAPHTWPQWHLSPEQFEGIVEALVAARHGLPLGQDFAVAMIHSAGSFLPTKVQVEAYAQAGVNWILVQALSAGDALLRVERRREL